MTALQIDAGDVRLAVKTWGERGKGPTVVLVHGFPDSSAVWEPIAAALARDHFVVAYDVRGAGASSVPMHDRDYALGKLSADLAHVIAAVGGGPVHLVGHDWGSVQSWESVTEPGGFGGRIASFTSISGPCLDHVGHWMRTHAAGDVAAQAVKSWYVGAFHLPLAKLAWRRLGGRWPASSPGDRGRDGANGLALYRANIGARIAKPRERTTALPVQLIVPARDRFVGPHMAADGIARWAPNTWRRDVYAGHWDVLEDAPRAARWLAAWIAFVERGTPAPGLRRVRGDGPFAGKLAIVTGAGSGIGRSTTIELVARGADVIAVDLDPAAAQITAELAALVAPGRDAVRVRAADVASAAALGELAAEIARTDGAADIVINNAGIGFAGGFLATTPAEWDRVLSINLGGVVHGCRLFARQMIDDARPGHVINVASAAAYAPSRALAAYSTSKAAVWMLTECLRAELGDHGVAVGGIYPGLVDTPITTSTRFAGTDDAHQRAHQRHTARLYRRRALTADTVARDICEAIERDRPMTRVGAEAVGLHWLQRFAPSLQRRLARVDLAGRAP